MQRIAKKGRDRRKEAITKPLRAKVRFSLTSNDEPAPYTGKTAAGSVAIFAGRPVLIAHAVNRKYHGLTQGYIQLFNSKMAPTRRKGSWIGIRRIRPSDILCWGDKYLLVDGNYRCVLCRLYPSKYEDRVEIHFDNKKYAPYHVRYKSLKAIFLVEPLKGWPQL